jgi:hypothetical protein
MNEMPKGFVSASHAILFEKTDEHCNVCAGKLEVDSLEGEADDELFSGGRGLLVWARGEERRYEEPRLCAECASAIGVSALQRWEIEEDEG